MFGPGSRFIPFTAVVSFLFLCSQGAIAQETPGPAEDLKYRVEVELMQVGVRVLDQSRKPVKGMTQADFDLYEDGRLQQILYVDEIDVPVVLEETEMKPDEPSGVSAPAVPAPEITSLIIIVDGANSDTIAIARQREFLREFLKEKLTGPVRVSLVQIIPSGGFKVLQEPTEDRSRVLSQVDNLSGSRSGHRSRQLKAADLSNPRELVDCAHFGRQIETCIDKAFDAIVLMAKAYAKEEQHRSQKTIDSIAAVFRQTQQISGRKSVLLVSEGFDPLGSFFVEYAVSAIRSLVAQYGLSSSLERRYESDLRSYEAATGTQANGVEEITRMANAAGLTVYWADPEIGRSTVDSSVDESSLRATTSPLSGYKLAMYQFARDTGGESVTSTDYSAFYDTLSESATHYYVLSYKPSRPVNDQKFHSVTVKAKRTDYTVLSQKEVRYLSSSDQLTLELGAMHEGGLVSVDESLSAEARYFQNKKGEYFVFLNASVPYNRIIPKLEGGGIQDSLHFSFVVTREDGKVVLNEHPVIEMRSKIEEFESLKSANSLLEYMQTLHLKEGKYRISVAAVDSEGSIRASSRLFLDLTGSSTGCIGLSPLLLASGQRGSDRKEPSPTMTKQGDIVYGDQTYEFHMDRAFLSNGRLSGFYQIYGKQADSLRLSFLLYRGNQLVNQTEPRAGSFMNSDHRNLSNFFSLPYSNLPSGEYELELKVEDKAQGCEATSRAGFRIY